MCELFMRSGVGRELKNQKENQMEFICTEKIENIYGYQANHWKTRVKQDEDIWRKWATNDIFMMIFFYVFIYVDSFVMCIIAISLSKGLNNRNEFVSDLR